MSGLTRRDFIRSSMAVGAGLALATPFSRAQGANDDIRVAVVGVGGQGGGHMNYFSGCQGARLVAICDPDKDHLESKAKDFESRGGGTLKTYSDVRELLDDKEVDAITSATPNHWHALVTIWACQAEKDVYIEKPASHNIWEGRKMVEAARKHDRIVQVGTQRRSSEAYIGAYNYINEGHIGAVKWVRGFCYKARGLGTNGIVNGTNGPNPLPQTIDYNLWCGPADMEPLRRRELHYKWHWVWNTGNGDLGNQGVHEMDESRWALGDVKLTAPAISIGGRFGVHDAGQTANSQIIYFDYKPAPLIFEVRGLPMAKNQRAMDAYRGTRIGVVVQCENGYFAAGEGGGWIYDNDGNRLEQFTGSGGNHHQNFIDAVRNHKAEDLHADIEVGHYSAALCHMGNTSYRLGKAASPEEIRSAVADYPELAASFESMLSNLQANEVDLTAEPITLGPALTMDPETERYTGQYSELANMFIKRNYREPFVVPEQV